jgi:mannose-1-phosphate guanylyltransferase
MTETKEIVGAVLCAGFGTRLRPLTDVLPKPLLPFLNTPIVTYALDHLAQAQISDVAINLHHLADTIPPVVDRIGAQFGLEPVYSREWDILGTAGGIRGMWQALGEPDATMVVLNGDSIMNIDLERHLEAHRQSGARATIVVRPKADAQPGRVWLDGAGRLCGLRDMRHPSVGGEGSGDETNESDLVEHDFTGVHIVEPELIEEIPLKKGCMVGDVYGPLMQEGEAFNASVHDGFWAALDNPKLFVDTTCEVLENPALFEQAPLPEPLSEGLFIYKPDDVDDDAKCAKPVLMGLGTTVEKDAKIGPNAVIDGVDVAEGSVVRNAVVYGMGEVDGEWRDCIAVAGKVAKI